MNTAEIKVGDTAYIDASRYSRIIVFSGTVTKVTATGQVTVELADKRTMRFKPNGFEVGSDVYDATMLVDKERFENSLERMRAQKRVGAVQTAHKAFEGMRVDVANKVELLARVEALRAAVDAL